MTRINDHYLKLRASYLFSETGRRTREYQAAHADAKLIRLGIGDVTRPLPDAVIRAMHEAVDEMARPETFRGYRSVPIAFSGLVGIATAIPQAVWLPQPIANLVAYLALWVGAAIFNLIIIGVEVWRRSRRAAATRS